MRLQLLPQAVIDRYEKRSVLERLAKRTKECMEARERLCARLDAP